MAGLAAAGTRPAWSFTAERELPFALVQRAELEPGSRLHGPAIVLEPTATTYLDDRHALEVHPQGALVISRTRTEEGQGT